jgi:SMI1-KNR4 cell-wall
MSDQLDVAIINLKRLSGGRVTKVPLPDDQLLASYEKELGVAFSDDYKRFLKEASNVFFGTKDPLTVTEHRVLRGEVADALVEARRLGVPHDWLPICEDNGDYYCLTPSGEVRFWALDGLTDESWPNLASWIEEVWIKGG